MGLISSYGWRFSARARRTRAALFRRLFTITPDTRILDLGSADGSHIASVLEGSDFTASNVYLADISRDWLEAAGETYGFNTVLIDETGSVPFPDQFFDIVFCSSVIEHVTVEKSEVWKWASEREFRDRSFARQRGFANEVTRLGRQYFVQTPNRWFPVESHTWLPLAGYLPRGLFLPLLRTTNRFWVRYVEPDFCLLSRGDMQKLFPDAEILAERKFGLVKSLIAVKRD